MFLLAFALILAGGTSGQIGKVPQSDDKKVVLHGTVYDTNGSVIPFSHVLAENSAGKEYRATTNGEGIYKLELPSDLYAIEVEAEGFCPSRVRFLRVRKSLFDTPLDIVLEVAEGDPPCQRHTPVIKEPKKPRPKIRKPEIFRSIAE